MHKKKFMKIRYFIADKFYGKIANKAAYYLDDGIIVIYPIIWSWAILRMNRLCGE